MINNVALAGHLAKDPGLRHTQNGVTVGQFTLAVNHNFTNQQGDREADLINCVTWHKAAEPFANYARKGTLIGLTGRIQARNYDNQQGQRVYVIGIVIENFQLLESKEVNDQRRSGKPDQVTFDKQATERPDPLDPFSKDANPIDIPDDDPPSWDNQVKVGIFFIRGI